MNISKAKMLKIGDTVKYPEDRGSNGGSGKVSGVSEVVNVSHQGVEYIWVSLKNGGVWPSNRLGG